MANNGVPAAEQACAKRLLSTDHLSADGMLIEGWASMKSFKPKEGTNEPPVDGGGRNQETDFHGEKRSNDTRASTTRSRGKAEILSLTNGWMFRSTPRWMARSCAPGVRSTKGRSQGSNLQVWAGGLRKPQRGSLISPIEGQTGVGHQLVGSEPRRLLPCKDRGDNIRSEKSEPHKARRIRSRDPFLVRDGIERRTVRTRTFAWQFSDHARADGSRWYPSAPNW